LIASSATKIQSTLQLVLEAGAVAVIERPIRPFGLLTNLTIARSIWLEKRETEKTYSQTGTKTFPVCNASKRRKRS